MAHPTLELTLISAQDLKDVNIFSKMEVYAVASIAGDHRSQQRSPADRHNGKNPAWNSTLRFSLPSTGDLSRHVLHILLRSERALGDRDVGEVRIPLSELLNGPAAGKGPSTFVSYQVRKPSGKAMGVLNLSYKIIDSAPTKTATYPPSATAYPPPAAKYEEPAKAYPTAPAAYPPPAAKYEEPVKAYPAYPSKPEPVTAYPTGPSTSTAYPYPPQGYPASSAGYGYSAPPPQAGYGYPPQQQAAYGYPPPPQAGYGYAPAQAGYGYAAAPQQAKKNKFGGMGMGLGAGLLGGALGGLLLGEVVSDIGDNNYDGGYDGGFDDGGGFDF